MNIKPKIVITTIVCFSAFLCLLALGTWQNVRYMEKNKINQLITDKNALSALYGLTLTGKYKKEDLEYRKIKTSGIFLEDRTIFLQGKIENKMPVFYVLTPLIRLDGNPVLVIRGWVKNKNDFIPPKDNETMSDIEGIIRFPSKKGLMQFDNIPEKNQWFSVDIEQIVSEKALDTAEPFIIYSEKITPQANGLNYITMTRSVKNPHFQYAATWFSLALILVILLFFSCRQVKSKE